MKALHVLPRAIGAAFLVLAMLCAGVPRHANAASGSPSLAGHCVAQVLWRCQPGVTKGDPICRMALHAPGPVAWAATFSIVSDATGHASYSYEATVAGAGSAISRQCTAQLYASSAVTGVCPMTAHGTGYFFAPQATFYSTGEWVTFYGPTVVREVHNAMAAGGWADGDLPIPPQPGFYDNDTVTNGSDAVNMALEHFGLIKSIEYVAVVARY